MYLGDRGQFEGRLTVPLPTASFGPFLIHHYYFLPNKLALTLSFSVIFQVILGKVVRFPTPLDKQLQKELLDCSGDILTAVGDTMCTHDFYEGELKGKHLSGAPDDCFLLNTCSEKQILPRIFYYLKTAKNF